MPILALGPIGSNCHRAATIAREYISLQFPETGKHGIAFTPSNTETLDWSRGEKTFGIVPIENSTSGYIHETIRFWMGRDDNGLRKNLQIVGEINLPITHSLVAHKRVSSWKDVNAVYSHPQALLQCSANLSRMGIKIQCPEISTAHAASRISEDKDPYGAAAIASNFAANIYGMKILKENIEDFPGNTTRFHIVGERRVPKTGHDRTSVIFSIANERGSLMRALGGISRNANMSSLHSIPAGQLGEYSFYCEFDCHLESSEGRKIVTRLKKSTNRIWNLGSYPRVGIR